MFGRFGQHDPSEPLASHRRQESRFFCRIGPHAPYLEHYSGSDFHDITQVQVCRKKTSKVAVSSVRFESLNGFAQDYVLISKHREEDAAVRAFRSWITKNNLAEGISISFQ
jgi:hypothetical protein